MEETRIGRYRRRRHVALYLLSFLWLYWDGGISGLLSPKGVNFEVQALMGIKASLHDPHGVLGNWDGDAVDPCSWTIVTCSPQSLVIGLGSPSQNLSGSLSPSIGNLTNLRNLLLQNNNITGTIPSEIGKLRKLLTLDLSNNLFAGEIPSSLGDLRNLKYMRLNNNSLSGALPMSLVNMTQLLFLDLSFNNLSGPIPKFPAKMFNIVGNPCVCSTGSEPECSDTGLMPVSMNLNHTEASLVLERPRSHKLALAFGSSIGFVPLIIFSLGLFLWGRQRQNHPTLFDTKGQPDAYHEEVSRGNLRKFHFRELQAATHNFSNKNILGKEALVMCTRVLSTMGQL